ncbi:MAG: hypothetical protein DI498_15160 [Paracoccus denitrificans]|nr:MAG: hypothetical protein DI498_15160 [Paracoccus denitrificans]PZO82105.1 MAG: hypothetical protein DI633_15160 [Paracoccus denitrificans]
MPAPQDRVATASREVDAPAGVVFELIADPARQLWRWEVEGIRDEPRCRVTHTYDWTELTDPGRIRRALRTGPEQLRASIDRLAELARTQPQA